jgi:hypothetical protein
MVTLAPPSSVLNPTLGAASDSIEAHAAADIFGSRPTEVVDPLLALVTVIFPGASPVPEVKVNTTPSPARTRALVATAASHARTAAAMARRVVCIGESYHAPQPTSTSGSYHVEPALLRREASSRAIHRRDEIEVYRFDPTLLDAVESLLGRSTDLELVRSDGRLYVTVERTVIEGDVQRVDLAESASGS